MTIGIYALRFLGTDKVYIGQSINIEARYLSHIYKLKVDQAAPKLQKAYSQYGTPTLEILAECTKEELDTFENETIEIWDSVANGFNTMSESGHISSLYGDACGNSKFTNAQIIEVFDLLVDSPQLTQVDIVNITDVSKAVVCEISCGTTHKWLADVFPERYAILMELKITRRLKRMSAKTQGKHYPDIVSPEGVSYTVDNIRGFARLHGLNYSALGCVLRGKNSHHKGWKIKA
jgi:hypothetical protein